jgi:hypothetical protein
MRDHNAIARELALHRDSTHGRLTLELIDALTARHQRSITNAEEDRELRRHQGALKLLDELKKLLTTAPLA